MHGALLRALLPCHVPCCSSRNRRPKPGSKEALTLVQVLLGIQRVLLVAPRLHQLRRIAHVGGKGCQRIWQRGVHACRCVGRGTGTTLGRQVCMLPVDCGSMLLCAQPWPQELCVRVCGCGWGGVGLPAAHRHRCGQRCLAGRAGDPTWRLQQQPGRRSSARGRRPSSSCWPAWHRRREAGRKWLNGFSSRELQACSRTRPSKPT